MDIEAIVKKLMGNYYGLGMNLEIEMRAALTELAADEPRTLMTDDEAKAWAWKTLKADLEPRNWTAGESGNFYGFFHWGWVYRAQYEKQKTQQSVPVVGEVASPSTQHVYIVYEDLGCEGWVVLSVHADEQTAEAFAAAQRKERERQLMGLHPDNPRRCVEDSNCFIVEVQPLCWPQVPPLIVKPTHSISAAELDPEALDEEIDAAIAADGENKS